LCERANEGAKNVGRLKEEMMIEDKAIEGIMKEEGSIHQAPTLCTANNKNNSNYHEPVPLKGGTGSAAKPDQRSV